MCIAGRGGSGCPDCIVAPNDRVQCKPNGTERPNQDTCVAGGCCYDPVQFPSCFTSAAPANHTWSAVQELYEPALNTTMAAGTAAEVQTSAVFAPETNVMTVRLRSAAPTTLSLRLSTQLPSACSSGKSCMADLPMAFHATAEAGGGAALTMKREANHWINNEAALVECDPALIPTLGTRAFAIGLGGGPITLANTSECLALQPAEGRRSTARRRPETGTIVSRAPCSTTEETGPWSLTPGGLIKHAASGMCAVYSTSDWGVSVFPADCAAAAANATLGTAWVHDAATGFLRAGQWAPTPGLVVKGVPQAVPHCLLAPVPNVNVSLGMAVLLKRGAVGTTLSSNASEKKERAKQTGRVCAIFLISSDHPHVRPVGGAPHAQMRNRNRIDRHSRIIERLCQVAVEPGSAGAERYASHATFKVDAGVEYVLAVSIETTRTSDVPMESGALPTALRQVRGADADAVSRDNRAWWAKWWETGATVDLGPRRQTLERFWYGQQYMLGSMSRPCRKNQKTKATSGRCRDGPTVPGEFLRGQTGLPIARCTTMCTAPRPM